MPQVSDSDWLLQQEVTSRTLYLTAEVDESLTRDVLRLMNALWAKPGPITVVMNTEGGSIIDGLAIYEAFRASSKAKSPVTCIVQNAAYSMGAVILQGAERRLVTPSGELLIHEASSFTMGTASSLKDDVKHVQHLNGVCNRILAERSTLSAKQIAARCSRKDWWLTAEEALQYGFVDGIAGAPPRRTKRDGKRGGSRASSA